MNRYRLITFFCFLCFCLVSYTKADEPVRVNTLNKSKWEKISAGLDYTEEEKKQEKPKQEVKEEAPSKDVDLSFLAPLKVVGFILIIALIGFILAKLLPALMNRNSRVQQDIRIEIDEEELQEENIAEWPLQKLLSKYIQEGDIRNAIRIYYLMSLQLLHLNGLIQWKKDKTNSRYVMELASHERGQDFSTLTQIYETTWYGQFIPDETMFALAKSQFGQFNAQFPTPTT